MSSYIKLFIFVLVLVSISIAVLIIDSSIENVNAEMPDISDSIAEGDKNYNESVELLNNRSFTDAKTKADDAEHNYNRSLNKMEYIRNKFDKDLNNVHKEYIDTLINELTLKIIAVGQLKQSIEYLESNNNYTGSNYGFEANNVMSDAIKYQNKSYSIVKNNPKLFK